MPEPYVERYRLSVGAGFVLLVSAVFVLAAPFAGGLLLTATTWVLFGGGGLLYAVLVLSRKVALRVDAEGVTLGGSPLRYAASTTFVPWLDIDAVVLWTQVLPYGQSMRYVGVRRRGGAPAPGHVGRALSRIAVPYVPPEIVAASRPVNGWRLDRQRLAAAVEAYAPGTPILDDRE